MNRAKKKRKKQILYFAITLLVVLCLGTVALWGTMERKREALEKEQALLAEQKRLELQESIKEQEKAERESEEAKAKEELWAKEEEATEEAEKEEVILPVTMAFGGDICFYDAFANMHALKSRGGRMESSLSGELLLEMQNADILMLNNEFTYSDRGAPLPDKAFTFRSRPENVELLHEMGVDIVSLANNHVYDYGEDALFDTLDILKNAGVPYVGAGRNLDEAAAPYYFEMNGRKIAFVSATQVERNEMPDTKGAAEVTAGTFRCFTEEEFERLLDAVREADQNADLTVVYIHWGTENTDEMHWAQEWQAPEIVDAGADLIVGDHPHCLQKIEYIKGVPVFYSLGNFWFNSKTLDTGLLKVTYNADDGLVCQFLPAIQHDCRTDMVSGEEKQRILKYLQCISPNVTIDADGYISNAPYTGPPIDYDAVGRVPKKPQEPQQAPQGQPLPEGQPGNVAVDGTIGENVTQ